MDATLKILAITDADSEGVQSWLDDVEDSEEIFYKKEIARALIHLSINNALSNQVEQHIPIEVVDYSDTSGSNQMKYKNICATNGEDYPCRFVLQVSKDLRIGLGTMEGISRN
jgi:hypothetical protein